MTSLFNILVSNTYTCSLTFNNHFNWKSSEYHTCTEFKNWKNLQTRKLVLKLCTVLEKKMNYKIIFVVPNHVSLWEFKNKECYVFSPQKKPFSHADKDSYLAWLFKPASWKLKMLSKWITVYIYRTFPVYIRRNTAHYLWYQDKFPTSKLWNTYKNVKYLETVFNILL